MITRRSVFGVAAGLAALVGVPAWAREPRHLIYRYSDTVPNLPLDNYDEIAGWARENLEIRLGDLSTVKLKEVKISDDKLTAVYCWQCERTDAQADAYRDMRRPQIEAVNEWNQKHLREMGRESCADWLNGLMRKDEHASYWRWIITETFPELA